jgi:Zn-finger nucleic acid-binding protein
MKAVTEIEKMVQKKVYARSSEWYSEDKRFKDDLDFYMRSTKKKKNIKKTSKTTEIVY